jgi:hypothetical protein
MADSRSPARANGFSLVEMMVALVFTMLLMAGMASVFKASLSTFYTSGETLSSARRNRMSMDMLGDDLNTACMFLADIAEPPTLYPNNPPFYILPNMAVVGAPGTPGPNDPTTGDELYFYLDQAMPFQGNLKAILGNPSAPEMVMSGAPVTSGIYDIECGNSTYANMIQPGQSFIFKDSWENAYITAAVPTGSVVRVTVGPSPNSGITGVGSSAPPSKYSHIVNPIVSQSTGIVFISPGQMVRYRVQYLQLDPGNANGIPCLVRDQGLYTSAGFAPNQPQQIITENVEAFKVYLSVNSGQTWAGLDLAVGTSGFNAGWTNGILTTDANSLTTQLGGEITTGWTNLASNLDWFRSIPTLVRVDITTRTSMQRSEYSSNGATAISKLLTQSLVFVPRHSGLTMN